MYKETFFKIQQYIASKGRWTAEGYIVDAIELENYIQELVFV